MSKIKKDNNNTQKENDGILQENLLLALGSAALVASITLQWMKKLRRKRKKQEAIQRRGREQAENDAAISRAVTPLLKKQAELHEIIKGLTLDACEREWGGKKSLVIDIETTGLNPYEDEILECSIISTDGTVLFHSYVKPCAEAWPEAQDINGITPEMVKDAPTISQLRAKISKVLSQASTIIGYDTNIDLLWLVTNGITVCDYINTVDVIMLFAAINGQDVGDLHNRHNRWECLRDCADCYGFDWNALSGQTDNSFKKCQVTLYCYQKTMELVSLFSSSC